MVVQVRVKGESGAGIGVFLAVLLSYTTCLVMSWQAFGAGVVVPAFFPAAGVAVGAMILTPRKRWPVILAAIAIAQISVNLHYGSSAWDVAGYTAANLIEPLVGASLALRWCGGVPDLRDRGDFVRFILTACTAGPLIGGLIGGLARTANDGVPWPIAILHWWAGDGVGAFIIATPILLWPKQFDVLKRRWLEAVVGLAGVAVCSVAAYLIEIPRTSVLLALVAWSAFRLNVIGASLAGAVLAFVINFLSQTEHAPLSSLHVDQSGRLAMTQVFIATIALVGIVMAQEVAARTTAVNQREADLQERIRLESLARLAHMLATALTPTQIGNAVVAQVLNDASAQALALGVLNNDATLLEWVGMAGYSADVIDDLKHGTPMTQRNAATDAIRQDKPIAIHTPSEHEQLYPTNSEWMATSGASSALTWPLKADGITVGTLGLMWTRQQPLDATQLAYVSAVAVMVGQALERARRYANEHARAAVLQAAVLPTKPANIQGLDFAVVYEPADVGQGLGGDWYDASPLPSTKTYLAIGDIIGHGLAAVEDMAQLRSASLAMALQGTCPARLLTELNTVTRHASHGKFATMLVAVWDPTSETLSYASAGHPPAFVRRFATGAVETLTGGRGPVLGPIENPTYTQTDVAFSAGDILVMYTDGLIERPDRDIGTGMACMYECIQTWPTDIVLFDGCRQLSDLLVSVPRADDVCLIAVRPQPVSHGPMSP